MQNLFGHLKEINERQDPNYWDTLDESSKKTFSNYMINKFLSMEKSFVEVVNIVQKYSVGILRPKEVYKLYINIIPKGGRFLRYVKGKKDGKYNKGLLEYISKYFEIGFQEAEDYVDVLFVSGKKDYLQEILQKYGLEKKEIKKLLQRK